MSLRVATIGSGILGTIHGGCIIILLQMTIRLRLQPLPLISHQIQLRTLLKVEMETMTLMISRLNKESRIGNGRGSIIPRLKALRYLPVIQITTATVLINRTLLSTLQNILQDTLQSQMKNPIQPKIQTTLILPKTLTLILKETVIMTGMISIQVGHLRALQSQQKGQEINHSLIQLALQHLILSLLPILLRRALSVLLLPLTPVKTVARIQLRILPSKIPHFLRRVYLQLIQHLPHLIQQI